MGVASRERRGLGDDDGHVVLQPAVELGEVDSSTRNGMTHRSEEKHWLEESLGPRWPDELLRMARPYGGSDHQRVEDLAHEAILRLLHHPCPKEGVTALVRRVMKNLQIDHWRKQRLRREESGEGMPEPVASAIQNEDSVTRSQLEELGDEVFMVVARFHLGLSWKEIHELRPHLKVDAWRQRWKRLIEELKSNPDRANELLAELDRVLPEIVASSVSLKTDRSPASR